MFHEQQTGKLTILYGTARTGKTTALMDRIKQDAAAGIKVCVLIPDQFTFEYEKMLCCHLGAPLYNSGIVDVLSFSRLTRTVFRKTHFPKGDAADKAAKTAILRTVITELSDADSSDPEKQLMHFSRHAKRSSFVNTLMTMLTELIHSGVTPEILESITNEAALNNSDRIIYEKLHDLCLFYKGYLSRLDALSLRDSMEDTRIAAEYAVQKGIFTGMSIYLDEFKSFTGDQTEMIKAVYADCAAMTVCMTTSRIDLSPHSYFSAVNETCIKLMTMAAEYDGTASAKTIDTETDPSHRGAYHSPAIEYLSRALISNRNVPSDLDGDDVHIVSASDLYSECDYVCSEIKRLTAEDSTLRYSDIAVLSRSMNEDISTLAAHFDRYGIPYFSSRKTSAKHHPMLLALTTAISLTASEKLSSEMLFTYAKTGLSPLTDQETSRLEQFAFRWSVDGDIWEKDFSAPDSPGDKAAEELRDKLTAPILALRKKCLKKKGVTGSAVCSALKDFIISTKMEEKLRDKKYSESISDAASLMQEHENQRICEETDKLLDSLSIALPDIIPVSQFRDIFLTAAENIKLSDPPMSLDAVSAQQSDIARLSDPKIVFVIHANEGIFPDTQSTSETFSDKEREFFKAASHELTGSMKKRLAEERVNAYKALCAPSHKLYITWSRNDISGKSMRISPLAEKVKELLPKCTEEDASKLSMLRFCQTRSSAFAACVRNTLSGGSEYSEVRKELEKDPLYAKKFRYLDSVATGLTAKQEIDPDIVPLLMNGDNLSLSQTSFEKYISCPLLYLMSEGLKVKKPQKTELSSIEWGNSVHECMRELLEKYSDRMDDFAALTSAELETEISASIDNYMEKAFHSRFSVSPDFDFFVSVIKRTTLRYMLHFREEMQSGAFTPAGFEIPMGDPRYDFSAPSDKAIVIDCGGHKINFSGKCDRADIWEDANGKKYLRIIDYKTGRQKHKLDMEQIENGINLQMLLYYSGLTKEKTAMFSGAEFGGALYARISAPDVIENRYADEAEINAGIDDTMRLEGLISDNNDVIEAMESTSSPDEPHRFIDISGKISDADVKAGLEKSEALLKEMCGNVYDGKFSAEPLKKNGRKSDIPCMYCDYKGICSSFPDIKPKEWVKLKK